MTNYEMDARVPLLIAGPGVECAGKQTEQLAELLDLYPTLCELAGIEVPEFVDGASLVPILKDVDAKVHDGAVNQYYRRHEGKQYMGYSIRTNDYRLVEWRDFSTGEVTARELYHHRTDDSETESIIDSAEPSVIDELTALLLATHPRKGLVMTPSIHAQWKPDGSKGKLTFQNATDTLVRVHPITSAGRRGKVKRVQPGGKITLNARIGSVYVLESHDGTIQQIQSLSKPTETVVIQRDAPQ
jgi:iduronate 2-sulfatase